MEGDVLASPPQRAAADEGPGQACLPLEGGRVLSLHPPPPLTIPAVYFPVNELLLQTSRKRPGLFWKFCAGRMGGGHQVPH